MRESSVLVAGVVQRHTSPKIECQMTAKEGSRWTDKLEQIWRTLGSSLSRLICSLKEISGCFAGNLEAEGVCCGCDLAVRHNN